MQFDNLMSYSLKAFEYFIGTIIAKSLLHKVGSGSKIHCSVKYWKPSKIWIGDNCEIRHGTFLDARSDKNISIRIGDGSRIKDYVGFATYGGEIHLGSNVLVGRCSTIFGHGGVYIRSNSMLSPYTTIISSNYLAYLDGTPFQFQGFTREAIHIGENVWIGSHVCVLAGSNIGSNVVVGAGAVVHGSLESGWFYGGVPAKPIKPLNTLKPKELHAHTRNWGLFD